MSFMQRLWLIIILIVPTWILNMPFFKYLLQKREQVDTKQAFANMSLGESLRNKRLSDSVIEGDQPLPKGLRRELMPKHIAVILDGNRRWAKKRGLLPVQGYEPALETLGVFLSLCRAWNIPIVSLFLFSTENWGRSKFEVDFLLELFEESMEYYMLRDCRRIGGRVSVIGDISSFPNSLQKAINQIEEDTKDNTGIHLILAMSYSGQDDIVHACQSIAKKVKDGLLQHEDITKSLFEQHLQTKVITDVPSPDLLIRTSGEIRVSNYYLWQSAYSEMYFTDTLWPDFGEDELVKALHSFQQRGRRYGKV